MKRTIACLFLGLAAGALAAQEPARTFIPVSVSFLQSQEEMIPRIDDVSLKACIESYQRAASEALAGADTGDAHGLLIAVGVKPGKRHFVWCEAVEGKLPQATQDKLDAAFAGVPRVEVKVGPIAFIIRGTLKNRTVKAFPQFPAVWDRAMQRSDKPFLTVEELFRIVWPG